MGYTVTLSSDYGYVILAAALITVVGRWHDIRDYNNRMARDPNANAPDVETKESIDISLFIFKRSQVTVLEHQFIFLLMLLTFGLTYPILSAGLGLGWCGAQVLYDLGYVNKEKFIGKGRWIGGFFWGCEFYWQFFAFKFGYQLLKNCP